MIFGLLLFGGLALAAALGWTSGPRPGSELQPRRQRTDALCYSRRLI